MNCPICKYLAKSKEELRKHLTVHDVEELAMVIMAGIEVVE